MKEREKNEKSNKIEHQIDNEGCKCSLCQTLIRNKLPVIGNPKQLDLISVKNPKQFRKQQNFQYLRVVQKLIQIESKQNMIFRIIIPQICILKKANPELIIHKKKESQPFKLIRNKQKLNFYQVKNFLVDSYIFHNQCLNLEFEKSDLHKRKLKSNLIKSPPFQREPIIIANGQLLCLQQIENLFKASKRSQRLQINYFKTFIKSIENRQIPIKVELPPQVQQDFKMPQPNSARYLQKLSQFILYSVYPYFKYRKGLFGWVRCPRGLALISFVGQQGNIQLPVHFENMQNRLQLKMKAILQQENRNSYSPSKSKRMSLQVKQREGDGVIRWMTVMQDKWRQMKQNINRKYEDI